MTTFDDYGAPLELSSSPGLAPLSGDASPPSIGLAADASASAGADAGGGDAGIGATAAPSSPALNSSAASQAATSGLGMADYKGARSGDDEEYLKSLPTAQKIGLMLQSFSAGVSGAPNPIDTLLDNKRKREVEFRNELATTIKTIDTGMKMVKGMSPGPARDALIEQVVRASGGSSEVKNALLSVGTQYEDQVRDSVAALANPAAQALVVKASGGDPEKARQLLKDKDFITLVKERADQQTLPSVTAKLAIITRAMAKMPEFKGENDSASFTMADLRDQNAKLPKEIQLTEAELDTANRNQAALITYGMKTDKTQQDEQSADAKRKEEGPHTEIAKANSDLQRRLITKSQHQALLRKALMANEKQDAKVADTATKEATFTKEALEDAAHRYLIDGTLPPNLGRGTQGAANSARIMNRAAELARENGDNAEEARIRQLANKANSGALVQLTKQEQQVGAFEKNAIKNADIALANSKKVDRTGSPVVNRWILAGMKEVAGDKDVATFHQATETFINEYAKIMSGSMGSTATTDSLRKEVHSMLSTANTPEQYEAVVAQMKLEMRNRMKGFSEQKASLTDSMRAPKKEAAPADKPAAATAEALPLPKTQAELVAGKKYQTSRGIATWDGKKFVQ